MNVTRITCPDCNGSGIGEPRRRSCVVDDLDKYANRNRCCDNEFDCHTCHGNGWTLKIEPESESGPEARP